MTEYLQPTYFLDFDTPEVRAFAEKNVEGAQNQVEQAVQLYNAVRDGWFYDPYYLDLRPEGSKASTVLKRPSGHCVNKAVLLAASGRAVGIPTRLSFFIVRNHIATERIERYLQTNKLVFHGATELFLEGKWVKATPAFNKALCQKLNVEPLEFIGTEDSIFQQFDRSGNVFMEYLHEYGSFADMPLETMVEELLHHYSAVISREVVEKHGFVLDLGKMSAAQN
jgi:transglutaminase-like putative cysteine protease